MIPVPLRLDGVIAPICTPFTQDGEICPEALRRNIEQYNRAGLLGYVVAGSTGEAPFLSKEDKRALFQIVRESADGKVLIAGTGAESVRETLSQIRDAAAFDYDAALVITLDTTIADRWRGRRRRSHSFAPWLMRRRSRC